MGLAFGIGISIDRVLLVDNSHYIWIKHSTDKISSTSNMNIQYKHKMYI